MSEVGNIIKAVLKVDLSECKSMDERYIKAIRYLKSYVLDMFEEQQRGIYGVLVIIFLFLFRVNFLGRALPRVVSDFFFFNENLQLYTKVV